MHILLLAGGFATRLWPLGVNHAKPLLRIENVSLFSKILDQIPESYPITLCTNQKFANDFETEIVRVRRKNIQIFVEDAESNGEKQGALKAISNAIKTYKIETDIAIVAGDNYLTDFQIDQIEVKPNQAKIITRDVPTLAMARNFGVVKTKNNSVIQFEEKPQNPSSREVSTGFVAIGAELIPLIHEFAVANPDAFGAVFSYLLSCGHPVLTYKSEGDWFDIGSFETYLSAHKKIQQEDLIHGENFVSENTQFSGKIAAGKNVMLKNCKCHNVIFYDDIYLEDCHLSEVIIDNSVTLKKVDLSQKIIRSKSKIWG